MLRRRLLAGTSAVALMLTLATGPAEAHHRKRHRFYEASDPVRGVILTAAGEFDLDGNRVMRIAFCESRYNPNVGRAHIGLFQQSRRYWAGRVRAFNAAHPEKPVSADIRDPVANARVSAWMMSQRGGFKHWTCKG